MGTLVENGQGMHTHPAPHRRSSALLATLAALAVGCAEVDNSGGPPPAGDAVAFEALALPGTCGSFRDEAHLVQDDTSLATFFAACPIADEGRPAWLAAVDALAEDEALVYANVTLGGCLGAYAIEGAFLDDTTLQVWVLREDTAHGVANAACTDDIGEGPASLKLTGAGAATDARLTIGDFNPDLPNAPELAP